MVILNTYTKYIICDSILYPIYDRRIYDWCIYYAV